MFTLRIIANGTPRTWTFAATHTEARAKYEAAGRVIGLTLRELCREDGTPILRHTVGARMGA